MSNAPSSFSTLLGAYPALESVTHSIQSFLTVESPLTFDSITKLAVKVFLIFPLRVIAPASLLYTLLRLYRLHVKIQKQSWRQSVWSLFVSGFKIWSVAEVLFYFYYQWRSYRLNLIEFKASPVTEPMKLFQKCLDLVEDLHTGIMLPMNSSNQEIKENTSSDNDKSVVNELSFEKNSADLELLVRSIHHFKHIPTTDSTCSVNSSLSSLKNAELRGWFFGSKLSDIYRGNMAEWIAWAFFNSTSSGLNSQQHDQLEEMIVKYETWIGFKFPEGYNTNTKSIRLSIDPVPSLPRPLMYYVVTHLLVLASRLFVSANGFKKYKSGSLVYWYRPAATENFENPLVFCHGLGVGNVIYSNFIYLLTQRTNRSIFLLELPHIAMSITEDCPTNHQLSACIKGMLSAWNFCKAHFIGHSFGSYVFLFFSIFSISIVVAWMVRLEPGCVSHCSFIDPVCFLLAKPDVAFNFMYREPRTAGQLLMYYFVSRELYISNTLARNFHWYENILWPDDLQVPTLIVLAGDDSIVPSASIYHYFSAISRRRPSVLPIEILYYENKFHGESIYVDTAATFEIVEKIFALENLNKNSVLLADT